jgi:hypothetical protein
MTDDEEFATVDAEGNVVDTPENVPDWDDEYLDRVSDRLMFNYDLERNHVVRGETFPMYGELQIQRHKQFFHPALSYGHHESFEHLFVEPEPHPTVATFERLVHLGHDLADEWVAADEEHYSTEFIFCVVADELPEAVRSFVGGFRDRTLLKYGYNGHYEIHLVCVAPDEEAVVGSKETTLDRAFALWDPIDEPSGLFGRLKRRLLE